MASVADFTFFKDIFYWTNIFGEKWMFSVLMLVLLAFVITRAKNKLPSLFLPLLIGLKLSGLRFGVYMYPILVMLTSVAFAVNSMSLQMFTGIIKSVKVSSGAFKSKYSDMKATLASQLGRRATKEEWEGYKAKQSKDFAAKYKTTQVAGISQSFKDLTKKLGRPPTKDEVKTMQDIKTKEYFAKNTTSKVKPVPKVTAFNPNAGKAKLKAPRPFPKYKKPKKRGRPGVSLFDLPVPGEDYDYSLSPQDFIIKYGAYAYRRFYLRFKK